MLEIHSSNSNSREEKAANALVRLATKEIPSIQELKDVRIDIIPSAQCYGQNPQDIDLVVMYTDTREEKFLWKSNEGVLVRSFCVVIEVKGHTPEGVRFDGPNCSVLYQGKWHEASSQNGEQVTSLRNYLRQNAPSIRIPFVLNMIWLTRVPKKFLPNQQTNLLHSEITWTDFLACIAQLRRNVRSSQYVEGINGVAVQKKVVEIFSKRLEPTPLDRKRMDKVASDYLDMERQKYASQIGEKLLIFKGRGGTGKTITLLRIAMQLYNETGIRIMILTYNKALVADIKRLITMMGVTDAIGSGSINICTVHKFIRDWLIALGVISIDSRDFIKKYQKYKADALELLREKVVTEEDLIETKQRRSRNLSWDVLMIDECQDWPEDERDLLYSLYSHKSFIIADGVDQMVRQNCHISWSTDIRKGEHQTIRLTKSLRLKSALCEAVCFIAEEMGLTEWRIEPDRNAHGGNMHVVVGDGMNNRFHNSIISKSKKDGNSPVDMLICVPPQWVRKLDNGKRTSLIGQEYLRRGLLIWDGVDSSNRDSYPQSSEQYRIVQYDSCRGLEGWVTFAMGLDQLYEYKYRTFEVTQRDTLDNSFDETQARALFAKRWLMIPLTRAMDTLVLHVSDSNTYVGTLLKRLHELMPEIVEWHDLGTK